jgi:transcriptional regulator with GAF, ATPase, and Fis domain
VSEKLVATYPLPDSGEIRIGRSPECEILIDEPSMSRFHAVLTIGPPLLIRDNASANGTRLRERPLQAELDVELHPGEPVQFGTTTLIVQRQAAPIRLRRLWTHDYFEVRVDEECARAERRNTQFGLLRIACMSSSSRPIQDTLADLARVSDVVGEYGPSDYEILLLDSDTEQVETAIQRLTEQLALHEITVKIGSACYPRDGRTADALLSRAGALMRGAIPADADAVRSSSVVVAEQAMQDLYELAGRIANGTITVLILGETGVGKEVLAERVHRKSPRASKPYLRLNCASLSETLLESELFGYERGAFTGAVGTKQGLLETADGGTVFLDEIGELPLSIQVKLLRVLEERMVMRVGGLKPRPLDVRFIAATNRDLELEIERGAFRQDLYFRINGATLVIPPLRERLGELPALARAFLEHAARQLGLETTPVLTRDVEEALLSYSWPGNIRELRNAIERAVLLSGDGPILPVHLPLEKMRTVARSVTQTQSTRDAVAAVPDVLRRGARISPEEERAKIEAALDSCGGNQTRAAKLLGIGRRTLINRVKEFGLARPRGTKA